MAPPVVGKRYRVEHVQGGSFVGRCVSAKGDAWEFSVEGMLVGKYRDWWIGDMIAVQAALACGLEEIPLDAVRGGA